MRSNASNSSGLNIIFVGRESLFVGHGADKTLLAMMDVLAERGHRVTFLGTASKSKARERALVWSTLR